MAFLHGIEHIDLEADFAPVNDVVTAVIGLIGTHDGTLDEDETTPVYPVKTNELVLCTSEKDDAKFGKIGTIPEALKAIRLQASKRGSALVFVISVGMNTDTITPEQIVGDVSPTSARTGLKLFATAKGKFGFEPMIYIAPHYSAMGAVMAELQAIANKNEAMAYIDAPDGYTFAEAIASRAVNGDFANLDDGQKLLFPHFLIPNPKFIDNETTPEEKRFLTSPMSPFMAGLRAKVDLDSGWHFSSSNHRLYGVSEMDVDLTFSLGDPNSEVNLLNAAGITTAVSLPGNGTVEWGNYTTGFPGNTGLDAFEVVRRTRAIMKRAIEQAVIRFIDKPFSQANIDAIRNTVNQYLNQLVAQGKLIYGKCFYKPESNPVGQLAVGHLTFDIEFTPSIPMQRLTFTYKIDLNQLTGIL